jgi:hypothetical protein
LQSKSGQLSGEVIVYRQTTLKDVQLHLHMTFYQIVFFQQRNIFLKCFTNLLSRGKDKIPKTLNYLEEELVSGDLLYELAGISSIEFHPKVQGDRGDT